MHTMSPKIVRSGALFGGSSSEIDIDGNALFTNNEAGQDAGKEGRGMGKGGNDGHEKCGEASLVGRKATP